MRKGKYIAYSELCEGNNVVDVLKKHFDTKQSALNFINNEAIKQHRSGRFKGIDEVLGTIIVHKPVFENREGVRYRYFVRSVKDYVSYSSNVKVFEKLIENEKDIV